jgi:dTDP-4-amino-4,6-dideoxygalactose transaminase
MKSSVHDLALFGGPPAFAEPLVVGAPNLGSRERLFARMHAMLDRNRLSNQGPYVQEFERGVAELLHVKHCVAVCNGTMALLLAAKAAGLSGEVLLPSFTFIGTAHALSWLRITPVFCDVDPRSHHLDPGQVERSITSRTGGIIGVHLWGRACAVESLAAVARRHGLPLLFDAAQAFACSYRGQMLGAFGRAESFSFHATKFCNTFEGGAVTTDEDELAAQVRRLRNFGLAGPGNVVGSGLNGKMSEASAAMGLTSLESLEDFVAANRRNYRLYREQLANIPGLSLLPYDERERLNYHYVVVEVDETAARVSRDQLQRILRSENVLTQRYFHPGCHRSEPYRSCPSRAGLRLPNTERLAERVLSLPTGMAVGPEAILALCQLLRCVVANGPAVRDLLAQRPE